MRIEVDCEAIRRNSEGAVQACSPHGIEVLGVTKACCGHPDVARAMLAGGIRKLADSRLQHVLRLRQAGIDAAVTLLRLPSASEADLVVRLTQVSLNSEPQTVRALSSAAQAAGLTHRVILMIETGDRREGVMPDDALATAREMSQLPGIELIGLGSNLACIGGVLPTPHNMQLLVDVVDEVERGLGVRFAVVSGGKTDHLDLLGRGEMPARVNQLRIGHGILLGPALPEMPLPYPFSPVFNVVAEVIELRTKPSLPEGPIAVDAFGRVPQWQDIGPRRRAILALGRQDLDVESLRPRRAGVTFVGASSDHTVLDVTEAEPPVHLGEELELEPAYGAVATAMAHSGVQQVIRPLAPAPGASI
jgi:ornithine racemase